MYCRYCGKQIDEDSSFCKYCGKCLNNIACSDSNNISFLKNHIVVIALLVVWICFAVISSSNLPNRYDDKSFSIFLSLLVTLIIIGLLYRTYKKHTEYPIVFFDKADSFVVNFIKYIYIVYTYFAPIIWMSATPNSIFRYFILIVLFWLMPTSIICWIYSFVKSRKSQIEIISLL